MDRVTASVTDQFEQVETIDGLRVETDAGWFLIRASGTQPLVRVTAEARSDADAQRLREQAVDRVTAATHTH